MAADREAPLVGAAADGDYSGNLHRDHMNPRRARGRVGSRALWRRAAAMLLVPARRSAPMARLRQVAMARAALPVRNWEASAAKVTSRTWCRASMPKCPRIRAASWAGAAGSALRLVTA